MVCQKHVFKIQAHNLPTKKPYQKIREFLSSRIAKKKKRERNEKGAVGTSRVPLPSFKRNYLWQALF